jgi:hypothetical protein
MSMLPAKSLAITLALAGAVMSPLVTAASTVVPASPLPFEGVNLRMRVDSCEFSPADVVVTTTAGAIRVQRRDAACSPPGLPKDVDVLLGAYPAGTYNVELVQISGVESFVQERLQFTVRPRPAAFTFPLTDYSGLWWNPQESGWGLSIHQSARYTLFAALYVYDSQGRAQWFTIQPGGWTSSTRWAGPLYRTTGPYFAGPSYDPNLVVVQAVGNAVLEFDSTAAGVDRARFTYTIDGVATTVKTITRMAF